MQAKLKQALGMLGPMFAAGTTPAAAPMTGAPATPGAAPATSAIPLQPGQVMLNGVPTVVGATAPAQKKGFLRRIFGG